MSGPPRMIVEIVFADDRTEHIEVRDGDDPGHLAREFLGRFGLPDTYEDVLKTQIEASIAEDERQRDARRRGDGASARARRAPEPAADEEEEEEEDDDDDEADAEARYESARRGFAADEGQRGTSPGAARARPSTSASTTSTTSSWRARGVSKLSGIGERERDWLCPKCGHANGPAALACQRVVGFRVNLQDACPSSWAWADEASGNRPAAPNVVRCDMARPDLAARPPRVTTAAAAAEAAYAAAISSAPLPVKAGDEIHERLYRESFLKAAKIGGRGDATATAAFAAAASGDDDELTFAPALSKRAGAKLDPARKRVDPAKVEEHLLTSRPNAKQREDREAATTEEARTAPSCPR
ncbi:hypothetical protein SO694_00002815 [Aureococcus anophagefferens]|uniref:RanBP2-type domain-containing protein n=1 Tax=Aureococcus anophagefferens TaxID=44056 RepID=A0ABR1GDD0_AURAN